MQLRSQVEWALHCCAILAGLPPEGRLATKALAELHGVPKEYLSKGLQALSQAGLVTSSLGPSGGYRLAREPGEISFLDVVEAVEGMGSTFVCTGIRDNNPCLVPADIEEAQACGRRPCVIAQVMWKADRAWRDALSAFTLADLSDHLVKEIAPDLMARTREWVQARL